MGMTQRGKKMAELERDEKQDSDIHGVAKESFNKILKIGIYKELNKRGLLSGEQLNLLIGGIK
jgi:hypothetical protein